jgi:hypothetical protein
MKTFAANQVILCRWHRGGGNHKRPWLPPNSEPRSEGGQVRPHTPLRKETLSYHTQSAAVPVI